MKVERILKNTLIEQFNSGKAIVLIGPRQVGKSTLINQILDQGVYIVRWSNGVFTESKKMIIR